MTEEKGINMTTGNVPVLLLKFAVPTIMQNIAMVINSIITTILAGKFVGSVALGAVAVTMPIIFIINSIAQGVTLANSILISQAYGRRDYKEIRRIIDTSSILMEIICLCMIIIGITFCSPILHLIHTPKEIFHDARLFMIINLCGVPFLFVHFLFYQSLRGLGDSKTPMNCQFVLVILNTIIMPLLVTGWFGLPKFGIAGMAITQVFVNFCIATFIIVKLKRTNSLLAPHFRNIVFVPKIAKLILKIGFPSMIQQILLNASVLFILSLVNSYGYVVTEGYGVGTRIDFIPFAMCISICMAVSVVSGQNLGVEKYDRVKQAFYWGLLYSVILSLIPASIVFFCPKWVMGIFVNDPQVIDVGVSYLRVVAINYVLLNLLFAGEGIPMAAGQTWVATCVTVVATIVVRIPVAHFLSNRFGYVGIWWSMVISTVVAVTIVICYFYSGKWKVKNLISQVK